MGTGDLDADLDRQGPKRTDDHLGSCPGWKKDCFSAYGADNYMPLCTLHRSISRKIKSIGASRDGLVSRCGSASRTAPGFETMPEQGIRA